MTTDDRIAAAKACVEKVVNHVLHSIALHENNEVFIYSDVISSQIPESYAANAFNLTRDALFRYSLIRLCALWDGDVSPEAETIARIVKLIDNREVISALMQETCANWPISDNFGRQQGAKATIDSPELQSIKNFRDKHIAHALSATRKEKVHGAIPLPAHRTEIDLLKKTVNLVSSFYCWVNGRDFDFDGSFEIRQGHAEALWKGCIVNPLS